MLSPIAAKEVGRQPPKSDDKLKMSGDLSVALIYGGEKCHWIEKLVDGKIIRQALGIFTRKNGHGDRLRR